MKTAKVDNVENEPFQHEKDETLLSTDEYLSRIGQLGPFQVLVMILFSLVLVVPACQAFIMVFIADSPPWVCSGKDTSQCNSTEIFTTDERCKMSRHSWKYVEPRVYSIVTQFDLACQNDELVYFASSTFFIGQIFGGLFFGWLSDRYGRKNSLFLCLLTQCILSFVLAFSSNIWMLLALRLSCGVFHGGVIVTAIVLSVELVGSKYRALAGLIIWNTWTVASCFMSLLSWLIPEWKKLCLLCSTPFIFVPIVGLVWLPESIRWYRSKNRLEDAEAVFRRVAKKNGMTYPKESHLEPVEKEILKKGSLLQLFIGWKQAYKTIIMCFMWFTNDTVYYGVALAAKEFGGGLYRDFVLVNIVDIPANLLTIYLINRIGRQKGSIVGYMFTLTSLISYGVLQAYRIDVPVKVRIVFGIVGKAFGIMSWSSCEIWAAELYATNIRSTAIGLFFVISQIGAAGAPWIAQWTKKFDPSLPFFIIGGLATLSCLLALTLPETNGKSIADVDENNENIKESLTMNDKEKLKHGFSNTNQVGIDNMTTSL